MTPAILLVPAEGDAHGLLAPGKCGARVPTMYQHPDGRWLTWWDGYDPVRTALVLAWDGEPVPEGCDRAARLLADALLGARPPVPRYGYSVAWTAADALVVNDAWISPTTWHLLCEWRDEVIEVEVAPPPTGLLPLLRPAWALATALVAKLGGEVVIMEETKP